MGVNLFVKYTKKSSLFSYSATNSMCWRTRQSSRLVGILFASHVVWPPPEMIILYPVPSFKATSFPLSTIRRGWWFILNYSAILSANFFFTKSLCYFQHVQYDICGCFVNCQYFQEYEAVRQFCFILPLVD